LRRAKIKLINKLNKKIYIIICSAVVFFTFLFSTIIINSYPSGFTGVTKKNGGSGCLCHGFDPNPSTKVFFSGPDSIAAGQSANYLVKIVNASGITGGFDAASFTGQLSPVISDTTLKLDTVRNELTHKFPKPFLIDTVFWTFKYTAPNTPQVDTLYAVGNATNNNGLADTLDQWDFSPNFIIKVYIPISVVNNSELANGFELLQNYPNPFNPETNITIKLGKRDLITLKVFDTNGNEVAVLENSVLNSGTYNYKLNADFLASGVYFCILSSSNTISTKKMILIK
jgi:hypothetical protein